jgi:hypothetical protein
MFSSSTGDTDNKLEAVLTGLCDGLRRTHLNTRVSRTEITEPLRLECLERALTVALDVIVNEAQANTE